MKKARTILTGLAMVSGLFCMAAQSEAATILQPAGASTNMGNGIAALPVYTIDQSGLSSGYTSLVTDFDTYIASNPLYSQSVPSSAWTSQFLTGNFDFDLGGSFLIDRFALWNLGSDRVASIVGFNLLADDNPAFSSPVNLGSFNADPGNQGGHASVSPKVVSFTPTMASHLRMQITSNFGNQFTTGFGEAAFAVVPEPSCALLVLLGVGHMLKRRKAG